METTFQEVKKWYNKKYQQYGIKTMRPESAYTVFLDHLGLQHGGALLDIACGTGFLLKQALQRSAVVSGIDISEQAIEVCKSVVPSATLKVAAAEELPFENEQFNWLTCLGSVEHFIDPEKALSEMHRVTTPTAKFCIVVPNKKYLFDLLSGNHGTEQQEIKETLRSYKGWSSFFENNGFCIEKVYQDQWIRESLSHVSTVSWIESLKITIKRVLWKYMPLSYTYQFIFILSKK